MMKGKKIKMCKSLAHTWYLSLLIKWTDLERMKIENIPEIHLEEKPAKEEKVWPVRRKS